MKNKTIIFLILISAFSSQTLAQKQGQERIDSLLTILSKTREDTNRVNLLVDLSLSYYSISPDDGIRYGKEGLSLAEKLNWKKRDCICF